MAKSSPSCLLEMSKSAVRELFNVCMCLYQYRSIVWGVYFGTFLNIFSEVGRIGRNLSDIKYFKSEKNTSQLGLHPYIDTKQTIAYLLY